MSHPELTLVNWDKREDLNARDLVDKLGYLEISRLFVQENKDRIKRMLESGIILARKPLPDRDAVQMFFAHADFEVIKFDEPIPTYDFWLKEDQMRFERRKE